MGTEHRHFEASSVGCQRTTPRIGFTRSPKCAEIYTISTHSRNTGGSTRNRVPRRSYFLVSLTAYPGGLFRANSLPSSRRRGSSPRRVLLCGVCVCVCV